MWRIGFSHFIRRLPSTDGLWASPSPRIVRPPVAACVVSACGGDGLRMAGPRRHDRGAELDRRRARPGEREDAERVDEPGLGEPVGGEAGRLGRLDVGEHLVDVRAGGACPIR